MSFVSRKRLRMMKRYYWQLERKMKMISKNPIELKIVEEDEDAIELLAKGKKGHITIYANIFKEDNRLILRNVHLDGMGSGYSSLTELRQIAREFGRMNHVDEVIIYGFRRTTGANAGKQPIPIRINVY
jgi:hypothetical protein